MKRTIKRKSKSFALCVDNVSYEASLILGKVYRILPDAQGKKDDLIRVVDESGEDYLFHESHFAVVEFTPAVTRRILAMETQDAR